MYVYVCVFIYLFPIVPPPTILSQSILFPGKKMEAASVWRCSFTHTIYSGSDRRKHLLGSGPDKHCVSRQTGGWFELTRVRMSHVWSDQNVSVMKTTWNEVSPDRQTYSLYIQHRWKTQSWEMCIQMSPQLCPASKWLDTNVVLNMHIHLQCRIPPWTRSDLWQHWPSLLCFFLRRSCWRLPAKSIKI